MQTTSLVFSPTTLFPGIHSVPEAIEFCFVMLAVLLVLVLLFRKAGRRYTPRGFAFLCLAIAGMGLMGSTGIVATAPSSAKRITVDGYCHDIRKVYFGRGDIHYVFLLTLNTGSVLQLQTPLTPSWFSEINDGTRLRVTYLNETRPVFEYPRAITLTVLSGDHIGWHGSVDANWIGAWLLFPIGLAVCLTGLLCAFQNRRLDASDRSDNNDGRNLDDGQNSHLTDLNLR